MSFDSQRRDEPPDLWNRERQEVWDEACRVRPPCGALFGAATDHGEVGQGEVGQGEVGQGEHGQGDVAVPPDPGPHLVVVRPHFALGLLEQALDGPPRARHPHQIGQARPLGRVGQVERHLVRPGDAAPDQERAREALGRAVERQVRPVIQARTLGAVPCAEAPPCVGGQVLDPRRHRAPTEPLARRDSHHVAAPVPLRPLPDGAVSPIHAVPCHPGERHARRARAPA